MSAYVVRIPISPMEYLALDLMPQLSELQSGPSKHCIVRRAKEDVPPKAVEVVQFTDEVQGRVATEHKLGAEELRLGVVAH